MKKSLKFKICLKKLIHNEKNIDFNSYYHLSYRRLFSVIPIKELWANSANKLFDTLAAGRPILINYNGWQKELINKKN